MFEIGKCDYCLKCDQFINRFEDYDKINHNMCAKCLNNLFKMFINAFSKFSQTYNLDNVKVVIDADNLFE
jgi:hypothetical protein